MYQHLSESSHHPLEGSHRVIWGHCSTASCEPQSKSDVLISNAQLVQLR